MRKILTGKSGETHLLLGNEAIARGAIEAGVGFVSCYPGTPSSEVPDTLYKLAQTGGCPYKIEYSINEKVAMEVACGAALAGTPSLVTMKHVGLNVAADPLFTAAYIGMPGGLVILTADDPGCHSSQNEQDNRQYARFASLPCFEPASADEAKAMTQTAFALARELGQPVLLRTTTRVSHMRGPVKFEDIDEGMRQPFDREPGRYVPVPAVALKRHLVLENQMRQAEEHAEKTHWNKISHYNDNGQGKCVLGIIASGVARNYLADALTDSGIGQGIDILELGQTWPLPSKKLCDFLRAHERVLVLEEGEPLLENDIRALAQKHGINVGIAGQDLACSRFGEMSSSKVKNVLFKWLGQQEMEKTGQTCENLPGRPPNLCPGCAHRAVYYAVRKVFGDDAIYSSDIGCYTLGLLPPLRTADFLVCMGSSVTAGSGFSRASGKTVVAFIGDSTFFHSGLSGLANAVFNNHNILLVILDNGTTAMTGHQPNPGMAQTNLAENCRRLDMEKIVNSFGVDACRKVKAGHLAAVRKALEELRPLEGVRVLIAQEPCMLYARHDLKKKKTRVGVVKKQGDDAERCARELACPAFARRDGALMVDKNLCSGCMVCMQISPDSFGSEKFV